jgi:FAD/FMN-containing dehydrogenase
MKSRAMPTHTHAVPPVPHVTEKQWTNWGGNQTCTPAFTVRPESEQQVVDAVRFAIKQGLPVRAYGAGHSFTPIVQTGGVLVDTEALTGVTGVDSSRNRVRLLGGTRLKDIGDPLWEKGLSLTNQGDIVQQAIAGAIATATHGSGIRQTSFSDRLRWARIVNGHGEVVEVDEHDLNRLRAAQVALGTLGIMTEVELEASPRYHLQEEVTYPHWDEIKANLADNVARHRHYSFLWCQTDESPALYELPCPPGLPMANRAYQKIYREVEVSEPEGISTTPGARVDRSYRVYDMGGMTLPFHELEYYVPAERSLEAIEAMQQLILTRYPQELYPLEVRWVKGDEGYLSPFYKRDTNVLSVSGAPGRDYWPYLRDVDALLEDFDARQHWGKIHFLTRERIEKQYPEYDKFVAVRREFDPNGIFLNDSLRQLVG